MAARHPRLPQRRGRLDGPGPRRRRRAEEPARRHPGHLDRREGAGRRREAARGDDRDRPGDRRPGHRAQLRRRLRRRGGDGGRHRPDRGDGQPADVRPLGVGRRDLPEAAHPALLGQGRHPAARPGHAGPVRARLDLEAVHDRRRAHQRLRVRHPAQLLLVVPGRQPGLQELRVRRLRARSASTRRSRSRATPSSTGSGYDFWQRLGSDVDDVDARDPLVEEAKEFGFGSETGIDLPGEASGRIADRKWKRAYFESQKDYYCRIAHKPQDARNEGSATSSTSSPRSSASRATPTAPATR